MKKIELIGKNEQELRLFASELGEKAFRGTQLYKQIYTRQCFELDKMSDIGNSFKKLINEKALIRLPDKVQESRSKDGSQKYLLKLRDGHLVESVYLPDKDRITLCLSTQVGCAAGCLFCSTGSMGFKRNLDPGEILAQYFIISKEKNLLKKSINIVFMGMGEPLKNYDAVMKAFKILIDPKGIDLSWRKITISTSGLVDGIKRLSNETTRPRLAISLNATTDEIRSKLMPVNKKYNLSYLLDVCKNFNLKKGERITFEYLLISKINDSDDDAIRLSMLLKGIKCKINLIPYNEVPNLPFKRPSTKRVEQFQSILIERHYTAIVRKSLGQDIQAACGQLAGKIPDMKIGTNTES